MAERFEIDWGMGDVLRDFGNLRDTLGGSSGSAASLSALGSGLGISDIRGAAEALHRASLSGLGQITASRYGLPYRPFEIGEATDRSAMLIQAIEGLRATASGPGGFRTALADARNLGIEDWIGAVHLTGEQFKRFKEIAQETSTLLSPDKIANATMFNAEMDLLNKQFTDLTTTLGNMVIPSLTAFLKGTNDFLRGMRGEQPAGSGLNGSMDALRQSVDQNTSQLQKMQGFWGGGARARGAIPGGYPLGVGLGPNIADNLRSLRKNLGTAPMKP